MTTLQNITTWLDDYLNTKNIPDYPNAYNGLQVDNDGTVEVIVSAVDASLNTIREAVALKADLIVVHHGLYWQGVEMLKGAWKEKCRLLIENNIALYSSHLPLDIHPETGNNILLAKAIGLTDISFCLPWKGIKMCVTGTLNQPREKLLDHLSEILGTTPQASLSGPERINKMHIITGGAGSEIRKISELGGETFLTGEGSHWNISYAEEKNMNFILGTHYLTETFGVESLAALIKRQFSLKKHEKIRTKIFL